MSFRIDRHLEEGFAERALERDVSTGLRATPKVLPPKWFYDARGSELFEEITRLPEYYPTRRERDILRGRSAEIADACVAEALVELGSGSSEKTRLLLDALRDAGTLQRFVPFDISEEALVAAGRAIAADYPGVDVHAVCGDFEHHLAMIPADGRRLVAFLGGTIGNFEPRERGAFLRDVAAGLRPGDAFLLGTDLVKDTARLEAAYDDPAGVTAAFNKNVLEVINRELGGDFDPDAFDHVARFDPEQAWIEMLLRSRDERTVKIRALDMEVHFAAGEEMRTEVSAKFRREGVAAELEAAGLEMTNWWTDLAGDFALSLSRPPG